MKECPVCKKYFDDLPRGRGKRKKYCSKQCRERRNCEQYIGRTNPFSECKFCGTLFDYKPNKLFCSKECRIKQNNPNTGICECGNRMHYSANRCSECTKRIRTEALDIKEKKCSSCDEIKSIDKFHVSITKTGKTSHRGKCKKCSHLYRNSLKIQCVEYKGGKCSKCNYDKCLSALEFHHRDPEQKDFSISELSKSKNEFNDLIKTELDKCDLLCSNCHRETHYELAYN